MSGMSLMCCAPAATSPATTPAKRAVTKIRRNTEMRPRSVAGEGEGVPPVMRGVVDRRWVGKADAVDEERAEQHRRDGCEHDVGGSDGGTSYDAGRDHSCLT